MDSEWPSANRSLSKLIAGYRKEAPEIANAFPGLAKGAIKPGALDSKTKELMALAVGIAARCDGCIGFHTEAAIKYGATRDEVVETIGVAVYMGGGPSYVYGAQVLEAFDQLAQDG
ncbi:MAG: carboxymuconolactone decarboxylase family protein [Alphaproteobacteria bacterium]|nr:carboxymuconolactone decarboxylase family protein [Alphaproteobacteria bacterium]